MTLTISFRQNRAGPVISHRVATLQDIENVKAKIIEAYQKTIIFIVTYAEPTLCCKRSKTSKVLYLYKNADITSFPLL
jgi:hypothetical protein